MKSILQDKKECFVCGLYYPVEEHHIYFGNPWRKISEKNGFKVWLCLEHHKGTNGVHGKNGHKLDNKLKKTCEKKYISQGHTKEEFRNLIGRNYLD